jgi:DNA-binding IclR family transcriptional regulator
MRSVAGLQHPVSITVQVAGHHVSDGVVVVDHQNPSRRVGVVLVHGLIVPLLVSGLGKRCTKRLASQCVTRPEGDVR